MHRWNLQITVTFHFRVSTDIQLQRLLVMSQVSCKALYSDLNEHESLVTYLTNLSSITKEIVFDSLEEEFTETSHFGMLHIRRGDATGECDTSLGKMRAYLSCSLEKIEMYGNITILFTSDEDDLCYRTAIKDMVEALGLHFVDLDSYIRAVVSKYAETIPDGTRLGELPAPFFITLLHVFVSCSET